MVSSPVIRVENLSKEYVVDSADDPHRTFYDLLSHMLDAPLRRMRHLAGRVGESERFWALSDVNFELLPGDVAGVIGRNGAGKSTLLKILSRITAPTRGRVTVRGRLASLLEVGTGFHPELSGRENIFLNGAILGMKRAEVARKFDEIVAFAEIDRFVDTPVKRYSSGMYVRLAFAVAAHLETDVLLVDEVLAVGDAPFQRKSLGKMGDVAKGGRTVLFVSHNLNAVRSLCSRALLFEGGRLSFDGTVDKGLGMYERAFSNAGGLADHAQFSGPLSDQVRFDELVCRQGGEIVMVLDPLREFEIELRGVALRSFAAFELNLGLFREGFYIASCNDTPSEMALREGPFVSKFRLPGDVFRPGRYTIGIGGFTSFGSWVWGPDVAVLDFSENMGGMPPHRIRGVVAIPCSAERVQ